MGSPSNQVIDVALGLTLIFLVLSLVCSLVQELMATALSWRARFLERGLANMLRDGDTTVEQGSDGAKDFMDRVLESPFIGEKLNQNRILGRDLNVPAYLPSATFSRAVLEALGGSLNIPEGVPQPVRQKLETLALEADQDIG